MWRGVVLLLFVEHFRIGRILGHIWQNLDQKKESVQEEHRRPDQHVGRTVEKGDCGVESANDSVGDAGERGADVEIGEEEVVVVLVEQKLVENIDAHIGQALLDLGRPP